MCCIKFHAAKIVWKKGGCQEIPWKFFCPTVPKNFAGEARNVSLISGIEKFAGKFGRATLCGVFQKNSGIEEVYG